MRNSLNKHCQIEPDNKKDFHRELLRVLYLAKKIRREYPRMRLAGTITQFVVGAVAISPNLLILNNCAFAPRNVLLPISCWKVIER
jgi:hypothetical protein